MTKSVSRPVRVHVLAAATALVLSSSILAPAYAAGRMDLSGLQAG